MDTSAVVLVPILGTILGFALIITVVVVTSRARTRRLEIQTELQSKLIDKFGSTPELIAFLDSKTGRDFVTGVQTGQTRAVRDRASGAVRLGIMFTAIGVGFLALWPLTDTRGLVWPGVLLFVMGAAYFASAYSLLRFNADREQPPARPAVTQE